MVNIYQAAYVLFVARSRETYEICCFFLLIFINLQTFFFWLVMFLPKIVCHANFLNLLIVVYTMLL